MKKLISLFVLITCTCNVFAQITDTTQLNNYVRDTIRDRRPEKVTAADIQKAFLGVSNILGKKGEIKSVNLPLTLSEGVAELAPASAINDGYLPAGDWQRFNESAVWKDTLPEINTSVLKGDRTHYAKGLYFGDGFYMNYYNDSQAYPLFYVPVVGQNVMIGGRAGAARYKSGLATGTENVGIGEWSLYQLTSGKYMTAVGKTAGGQKTNETYGIYIGHHAQGVAGRGNELQIGSANWIYGWNGFISLGNNNPTQRLRVGGKVQVDTIPTVTDVDSIIVPINGVLNKIHKAALGIGIPSIISITSSSTLAVPTANYNIIEVDASGGAVTLTLPSMTAGKSFVIKKVDSSGNAVNFTTDEGAQSITTQWGAIEVYRSSSSYRIKNQ